MKNRWLYSSLNKTETVNFIGQKTNSKIQKKKRYKRKRSWKKSQHTKILGQKKGSQIKLTIFESEQVCEKHKFMATKNNWNREFCNYENKHRTSKTRKVEKEVGESLQNVKTIG